MKIALAIILVIALAGGATAADFTGVDFLIGDGYNGNSTSVYGQVATDDTIDVFQASGVENKAMYLSADGTVAFGVGGGNNNGSVMDIEQNTVTVFATGQGRMWGIDVDSVTGDVYVLRDNNNMPSGQHGIKRYSSTGTLLGESTTSQGFDSSGNDVQIFGGEVYCAPGAGNGGVGVFKDTLGFTGTNTASVVIDATDMSIANGSNTSGGITFDTAGNLYLTTNQGILVHDGTTLVEMAGAAGAETSVYDIEFFDGQLWVANNSSTINIYDLDGTLAGTFAAAMDTTAMAFAASLEDVQQQEPIAEPAGLGLLGIALLGLRKRRS